MIALKNAGKMGDNSNLYKADMLIDKQYRINFFSYSKNI